MAAKPDTNANTTPVFNTSMATYNTVIMESSARKKASPKLKAFVKRAQALAGAR